MVSFPRSGTQSDKVTLKGAKDCVEAAKKRIQEIIEDLVGAWEGGGVLGPNSQGQSEWLGPPTARRWAPPVRLGLSASALCPDSR